jgi:hypothetical protein
MEMLLTTPPSPTIAGISPKAAFPLYNVATPASDGAAENAQNTKRNAPIKIPIGDAHVFFSRTNGPFPEKDIFKVDVL